MFSANDSRGGPQSGRSPNGARTRSTKSSRPRLEHDRQGPACRTFLFVEARPHPHASGRRLLALKHTVGLDLLKQTHETVQILLLIANWIPFLISLAVFASIAERHAELTGAESTSCSPRTGNVSYDVSDHAQQSQHGGGQRGV